MRTGGTFFYAPSFAATTNNAPAANTLIAQPFYVPASQTFTKLTVVCTTGVAATTARMGIYSDTSGKPDALVIDAGTVATTGSGNKSVTFGTPQTLAAGWYWLCVVSQGGAPTYQASTGNNVVQVGEVPTTDPFNNGPAHGYSQGSVSGALPSPWGATATPLQIAPIVWITPQ